MPLLVINRDLMQCMGCYRHTYVNSARAQVALLSVDSYHIVVTQSQRNWSALVYPLYRVASDCQCKSWDILHQVLKLLLGECVLYVFLMLVAILLTPFALCR